LKTPRFAAVEREVPSFCHPLDDMPTVAGPGRTGLRQARSVCIPPPDSREGLIMIGKTFVRLLGAVVCVAVVSAGWDAEAAHRHRRCCAPSCCYDPCCTPVCETVVTPSCCTTPIASCCAPVSYTVVREAVIVPAACCAATTTAQETVVAEKPVASSVRLASAAR